MGGWTRKAKSRALSMGEGDRIGKDGERRLASIEIWAVGYRDYGLRWALVLPPHSSKTLSEDDLDTLQLCFIVLSPCLVFGSNVICRLAASTHILSRKTAGS